MRLLDLRYKHLIHRNIGSVALLSVAVAGREYPGVQQLFQLFINSHRSTVRAELHFLCQRTNVAVPILLDSHGIVNDNAVVLRGSQLFNQFAKFAKCKHIVKIIDLQN